MNTDIATLIAIGVKALIVFGLGLYVVFSSVILRQEQLMSRVLEDAFEPVLRLVSMVHFLASIAVFLLAIVLL